MNLVTRFLAARRDSLFMRLGCWLVCFSLVIGLMLPQQRAEAVVTELTITAVASVAAAYLGACGLSFITRSMDKDALVNSCQRLIQEFLDTELGGMSIQDWLGNIWDLTVMAGKLIMGRPLTEEFVSFAQWVAQKYAVQSGINVVYSTRAITFFDGSTYNLSYFSDWDEASTGTTAYRSYNYYLGTPIEFGPSESDATVIKMTSSIWLYLYNRDSRKQRYYSVAGDYERATFGFSVKPVTFIIDPLGDLYFAGVYPQGYLYTSALTPILSSREVTSLLHGEDLSIDRAENPVYIPEGIAAEQGIALDVGAAETMDLDLVLQGVLADVLAGTLTATMEGAKEEVVDPPAGEITDVDELGLPALGAALTSRFPFSIPWDLFRAVKLLAAPAKAPYFEVDFMEPLADEVGGWNGSTAVVLDFSRYAIIGQVCRWTSTIGFCMMLASATKRLIWTA